MDVSRFLTLQPGPRLLRERASERADRVRFWTRAGDGWTPTTWRELHRDIAAATRGLVALGLMPGERAAIFAPNRVAWLEAAYAIQAAGAAMVPIYPASTAEQASYVLGHAQTRVVFVGSQGLLAKLVAARAVLTQVLERSDSTASEAKPPKERAEHVPLAPNDLQGEPSDE